jgi:hypothetical protein
MFTGLRNLNLAYNLLSDVGEFLGEVICNSHHSAENANNDEHDIDRIPLRMLNIRMNKFPYGYEDELVKSIGSLEHFEDYVFRNDGNDRRVEEDMRQ